MEIQNFLYMNGFKIHEKTEKDDLLKYKKDLFDLLEYRTLACDLFEICNIIATTEICFNKDKKISQVEEALVSKEVDRVNLLLKLKDCKNEKVNQQSFNYTKALDKVTPKKPICSKCKKEVKIVYGNLNLCANCISKSSMEYDKD